MQFAQHMLSSTHSPLHMNDNVQVFNKRNYKTTGTDILSQKRVSNDFCTHSFYLFAGKINLHTNRNRQNYI